MFALDRLRYKHILDIHSLRIDHQITCIMGTSGSGKTTLLRMLNRLNAPDEGSVLYNGDDIKEISPIELRRRIVMLSQHPILYEGTIRDNLQIGRIFSEKQELNDDELHSMLQRMKLSIGLDEQCSFLSGGERQRLCLARILLMDADVYLVDEPSSALDKDTELFVMEQLITYVKKYHKQLIMVTHSSEIAKIFPKDIIEIEKGTCDGYRYE